MSVDEAMSSRTFNEPDEYNPNFHDDFYYNKMGWRTFADIPSPTEEEWEDIQLEVLSKLEKVYKTELPWYTMWQVLNCIGLEVPTDKSQARTLTYTVKGQTFTFDLTKCCEAIPT